MSNTSVLLTCASVLDRLSCCEVQDLTWLDWKSMQSLDNIGELISFSGFGFLVSFQVGFVFLACQYYHDLMWFCKSEREVQSILTILLPFMMKLSTWAHMTHRYSVLFFCPRGGTSPVQGWATYLWKVCDMTGQSCQNRPHIWPLASIQGEAPEFQRKLVGNDV